MTENLTIRASPPQAVAEHGSCVLLARRPLFVKCAVNSISGKNSQLSVACGAGAGRERLEETVIDPNISQARELRGRAYTQPQGQAPGPPTTAGLCQHHCSDPRSPETSGLPGLHLLLSSHEHLRQPLPGFHCHCLAFTEPLCPLGFTVVSLSPSLWAAACDVR